MREVPGNTVYCSTAGLCEPYNQVYRPLQARWITPANVAPPTINYVAPNRQQIGGLCYYHAPFQTFQTKYAYEMDKQGWYSWSTIELDRSFLMSPVPFYECAGQRGDVKNFLDLIGLVDYWLDPYGSDGSGSIPPYPFPIETFQPDTCGYLGRYMEYGPYFNPAWQWPPGSHPLQQQADTVLTFRSSGWSTTVNLPEDPQNGILEVAADIVAHGPLVCSIPGHAISVIGFDIRGNYGDDPVFCYQDSDRKFDGDPRVECESVPFFDEFLGGWCSSIYHVESVAPPIAYDPTNWYWPFINWIWRAMWDVNADGIADNTSLDGDADSAFDSFDCAPRNPYSYIDTDGDGHCEPRLDRHMFLDNEEICIKWCESLELLSGFTGLNHGGGQGCEDQCRSFDRCTTSGIKNVNDNQCPWGCMSPSGRDIDGDGYIYQWEICDPPPNAERHHCCSVDELDFLDTFCRPLYHNVSNVDGDEENPATSDVDNIADICETAVSTRPTMSLDSVNTLQYEETPSGGIVWVIGVCSESRIKIEFGLFGGSEWLETSGIRYEIDWALPRWRVSDVGVCGCVGGWASCDECPETSEYYQGTRAWESIDTLECAFYNDAGLGPQGTFCDSKMGRHWRDEDCSDGVCNIKELYMSWGDHPTSLAGETIKVRVGVREEGTTYLSNKMYTSSAPLTLPTAPVSCSSFNVPPSPDPPALADWRYLEPHEPPNLPLGERLGALSLGREQVSKELFLFEFDKSMRGPLNLRRLEYDSPGTPRIEQAGFASVVARVKSQLFGFAGNGTQSLFVFGRREVPCPMCEDPVTDSSELWVAGLGEGQGTITRAEDVFGPSLLHPPPMARPVAAYDRTMSRLIVAGGGESGHFGVWAYTPHIGQWQEIDTPLPADLVGAAVVADRVRHRLYLLGGVSGRVDQQRIVIVDLVKDKAFELDPPPAALARSFHAMAMDPFNRYLYVFGGKQGSQVRGDLWQYDLRAEAWTQLDDGTDPSGPGPREQARMLHERRYDRLWITGGRDATGFKPPTIWGFSASQNLWEERPIAPEKSADGNTLNGLFSPDAPLMWEVSIDETTPYPGQLVRVALTSGDPCVGLQVWDSAGERISAGRHCEAGERTASFLGQPGERYVLELVALDGFVLGVVSEYELGVREANLVPAGSFSVGSPSARPVDLATVASPGGPVALVLLPQDLVSVDLTAISAPQTLDMLPLPAGTPTGLTIHLKRALVSMDSPGGADLLQVVAIDDPASLALSSQIDLPGQAGRLAALWRGGRVYAAKAGKLEVVDLTDPSGPQHIGSINVGGLITAVEVYADRLYVCTLAKRLKVYTLDRQAGEQLVREETLSAIGQAVRVHGDTVHVGVLPKQVYQACKAGGSCNTGGMVEVYRYDTAGALGWVDQYPMGVYSLPHLELTGSGAIRSVTGGFEVYRVEVTP
ncbi:MAG: kelch repeat-containing protein [bacterium]